MCFCNLHGGKNLATVSTKPLIKVLWEPNELTDMALHSFVSQASYFKKKYGEISIASSYEGYVTSCNYLNGLIYLVGNFKLMLIYFLSKINLLKSKTFTE